MPGVGLAGCGGALSPPPPNPGGLLCWPFWGGGPGVGLLIVALWFILRGDLLYVFPCVIFVLVFFSPFSIAIASLGEEIANLSAFRTFVRFVLVWICRFPLPLGVWEELRFVIAFLLPFFVKCLNEVQRY